ncbi:MULTISPECIES: metal-dependent hydrolase [Clostridium]|uniref:Inner membrane protein YdjM n=2 Tax=Clostridium TaxID=1485 RepID=A0A151ALG9_9CLOT|nr:MULTISPECIES: metal-dependent hydrolase [Clostridium]KYH28483.1 inner membrane protein YdjM [Clostridium colicanis DSM 13634]MBE6043003.1 metal-dependent hydrolase [Clostridium thermopalmarium]PRR69088.1 Inner membrane protein YdjM [Clostridium thermopalmarium DSM 5974]PVZ26561.1 inner membrane protein [Clostridium thermopalmarium DSM 5974]
MKGKTHAGIGAFTFISICHKVPGGFNYFGLLVVILASLIPDIDHPKSIINRYILPFKNKKTKVVVYICLAIIVLYFDYLYVDAPALKALGISLVFVALSSHRNGLTHSLLGLVVFTMIFGYLGETYNIPNMTYYFMIGYGMHLACDMMTRMGIPLFYPFIKKKYSFPLTYNPSSKGGSGFEDFLMIAGIAYTIYRLPTIF